MKIKSILFLLLLGTVSVLAEVSNDSIIKLDELKVLASKEGIPLCEIPSAKYHISEGLIEQSQISSLKNISALVPNLFIPNYGSKATSSIYVRGIGSRMNQPSIGLYIDNIPFMEKSAFDLDFYDIQHISVLQGSQGTMYGRNAIAGIVHVSTLSPLSFQGTKVSLSYGSFNDIKSKISHYFKLNEDLGVSIAGYYSSNDGYFENIFTKEKNNSESFGGRINMEWRMNNKWRSKFTTSYDNSNQHAFPYASFNPTTQKAGEISYNEEGSYKRALINSGLSFERQGMKTVFSSASSFQFLNDKMNLDQDFTSDSIFKLMQAQESNAFTQEFIFRSKDSKKHMWSTGLFGFYKQMRTNAPMTFQSGGIDMLQGYMDYAKLMNPMMPAITITNSEMPIEGTFNNPNYGFSLYHQSVVEIMKGLSLTLGLRAEYESTSIDYNSSATLNTKMQVAPFVFIPVDSTYTLKGTNNKSYWEFLPKIALKYALNKRSNVFLTVSKGYKAGGYNINMISSIIESQMQNKPTSDVGSAIYYKPEYLWNYEVGTNLDLIKDKLSATASVFYIDNRNQQLVVSTQTGTRYISNADKVESFGAECMLRAKFVKNLDINAAYGYTHATFKEYTVGTVNYAGNMVPFSPENTLSLGGDYKINLPKKKLLDQITIALQYNGFGDIYWNEKNTMKESFYGILNGQISFKKKDIELIAWVRNALNTEYNTFYFESMSKPYVQKGEPLMCGLKINAKF